MKSNKWEIGLNEGNCNFRIDMLTKEIERTSSLFTEMYNMGFYSAAREEAIQSQYETLCNYMDILTAFRRTHKCAIEGDPNYIRN